MERLDFLSRLWLALVLPWQILFDAALAARIKRLREGTLALPAAPPAEAPAPETGVVEAEAAPDLTPALQLLSILQREGRFIDFLQEDVSQFSDAEIGAAARVVHEGCKRGLQDYISFAPVRSESEGDAVELPKGFDATRIRVTGNVVGEPPFRGKLAHHGWRVTKIELPTLTDGRDATVVAPAEVEI